MGGTHNGRRDPIPDAPARVPGRTLAGASGWYEAPATPAFGALMRRAAGQLVDFAAYEGIGKRGVAPDDRLGEQAQGPRDQAIQVPRAELFDQVGDGGLLGGVFVELALLLLPRLDPPELSFDFASSILQEGGHLRQKVKA